MAASCVPLSLRPSCAMKDDNTRNYQVLCARSCSDDGLWLVLAQSVFRGAVAKKGGTRCQRATKPHYDLLPASACCCVQASVLVPGGNDDDNILYVTNASPLFTLQVAGNEQQVLYEVPTSHFSCMPEDSKLLVKFTPQAIKTFLNLKKAMPMVDHDAAAAASTSKLCSSSAICCTHFSFAKGEKGRENMKKYMEVMRTRYEQLKGKDLVDSRGQCTSESSIPGEPWVEVVARAPFYLLSVNKDKPDLSTGIFLQLRATVPTESNGVNKFRKLLCDIVAYAPDLLPGMPKAA